MLVAVSGASSEGASVVCVGSGPSSRQLVRHATTTSWFEEEFADRAQPSTEGDCTLAEVFDNLQPFPEYVVSSQEAAEVSTYKNMAFPLQKRTHLPTTS